MGESNKCLEAPRGSTFPSEADAANIFFPAFPSFSAVQMTCRIAIIVAKAFPAKHTHKLTNTDAFERVSVFSALRCARNVYDERWLRLDVSYS